MVEKIGIRKTFEGIEQAQVVLFIHSAEESQNSEISLESLQNEDWKIASKHPNKPLVIIVNKVDILNAVEKSTLLRLLSNIEGGILSLFFL